MRKSNKILFSRYALELFVIIFGITVSFIVNEWREERQNDEIEKAALQSILEDLIADSLAISKENETIQDFQQLFNYFFLNADNLNADTDSLKRAFASFPMYSTLEIKNVGYEQLKATGQLGLISNKKLLSQIIDIYTNHYAIAKEYVFIDKKMVLEEYIPFLMKEAPISITEINSSGNILENKNFQALVKNKTFKNMFLINMGFKNQIISQNSELKNLIKGLITDIKKELARL